MSQCIKCGAAMVGDGYRDIYQCEHATEEQLCDASGCRREPDAGPVYCDFVEDQHRYGKLWLAAFQARKHAYAPNSHWWVGAAVLTREGRTYAAANCEFTVFGDHAEQLALAFALKDGVAPADIIACATFSGSGRSPLTVTDYQSQHLRTCCGNCRQALVEINPDMDIIWGSHSWQLTVTKIKHLLPNHYQRAREIFAKPPMPVTFKDPLLFAALQGRKHSYVPRSHQPVGAAIEMASGQIYRGIRMETSSFSTQPLRVALASALMVGERSVVRLTLAAGTKLVADLPRVIVWDDLQAVYTQCPEAEVIMPDGTTAGSLRGFMLSYPHARA